MTIEPNRPPDETRDDVAARFVDFLRGLAEREERGALAALRRSLQDASGTSAAACPYVVPFLPHNCGRHREHTFFLVGALFALHPVHERGTSLGQAFRRISDASGASPGQDHDSTRLRFVALLDAHPDDVAEHVRLAVSLARAKDVGLDYARLLRDLANWGDPERNVQRRLAREFWNQDASRQGTRTA